MIHLNQNFKEELIMLNVKKVLCSRLATVAEKAARGALSRSANSTSCYVYYQPKAPKDLKKFRKF
ncbi:MAG: cyclic lactone autoinducer peptide [Ruminococcaceae bacterium]|nr:cyclic lactone autoinducer peptide [Oscillospiraceae bacterium]